ncbi:S24 family peptidase [Thiomonas sp.]|jgi:phage repressor protein C with HTH and peptisase S24 domain|uniref:S24 family peptidase n=1 Tax=Thiomonas sp. TaxID=2047785 RepID=UPI002583108F|nr:S24 family peptidase [Thiomonas sp.]
MTTLHPSVNPLSTPQGEHADVQCLTMGIRNQKLREWAQALGYGPSDLTAKFGRSDSFWSDRLRNRAIGEKLARELEEKMLKPVYWLDDFHYSNAQPTPHNVSEPNSEIGDVVPIFAMRPVPVVGWVKGGSDGYFDEMQYPAGYGEEFIYHPIRDVDAYAVRVKGDSMQPRYRSGEFIIVEPSAEAQPGDDVVVICKDGRKMLKSLGWTRDGVVSLLSINNEYPPITLELSSIERMHAVAGCVPSRTLFRISR